MARQGLNPRYNAQREIPTLEEICQRVHIERIPTWKNAKHGQQWINTLRDYAFSKIGRMPVDSIDEPEVLMCPLSHLDRKARNCAAIVATYKDSAGRGQVERLSLG